MKIHEFYLPSNSDKKQRYRVALGPLIDACQRKVFPPNELSPYKKTKTGAVGLMDRIKDVHSIPKKLTDVDDWCKYEDKEVLIVLDIGIEPEYRLNSTYLYTLLHRAEQIAHEWNLEVIVGELILNERFREFLCQNQGYSSFDDDTRVFKRLPKNDPAKS